MIAIIIIGVVILLPLIYLSRLKGEYEVTRSILIQKKAKVIFAKICDFKTWNEWSPWLIHEPKTQIVYSKDCQKEGGHYNWNGKIIGAGKLTHVRLISPHKIEQKIEFIKPFRAVCRVAWKIEDNKGSSKVTWIMQGKMPFLFRFMTAKTVQLIKKDYDFGLAMLNGVLDSKAERPKLSFNGKVNLNEQTCITKSYTGSFDNLKSVMSQTFPELYQYVEKAKNLEIVGVPFTAYRKINLKKNTVKLDICIPIKGKDIANIYETKTFPAGRYFKNTLQGSYKFLEFAWHHSFNHFKMQKKTQKMSFDWKRICLEFYRNDPSKVKHTNDTITEIYFPIK